MKKWMMFVSGLAAGIAMTATFASASGYLRVMGGVYGHPPGYGNGTVVCTNDAGKMTAGVRIEVIPIPIGDGAGNVTNGVTFRCP